MRKFSIIPIRSIGISLDAENICPDNFAALTLSQINVLDIWQGNRKMKLIDFFRVEGDEKSAEVEETLIRLDGDFSRVKRLAENMSGGQVEVHGDVGMRAGSLMKGGVLRIEGSAGDWLGREMRGGKIVVSGNAGNYVGSGYRGERCGMRGGDIEIRGDAGAMLGEHMCGGNITVHGNAGDFPGSMNRGGKIYIGGSTYLPGAEMAQGTITIRGQARLLPSYQKVEVVDINGINYQKYIGDLVENGKGELFSADVRSH